MVHTSFGNNVNYRLTVPSSSSPTGVCFVPVSWLWNWSRHRVLSNVGLDSESQKKRFAVTTAPFGLSWMVIICLGTHIGSMYGIYSNIGGILMVNGVQVEIVLQVQYWMVNTKHCNIKWLKWLRSLRSIILIPIWMINRLFQVCSHVEAKAASAFFRTLHPLWRLSRWRDGSDQVNHHLGAAQLWSRRNITAGHPPDAPWCWNMHTNIYPNKITQM